MIPEDIRRGLERYVKERIPTGHFLRAVLENDLTEAFGRADLDNREALFDIVQYVYNELPMTCWGSKDKVNEWLKETPK